MPRIDKAIILAAGFGTRLLPLTRVAPKPLLPLGGVPMLDRALNMVRAWGVRDVLVNVHHGADAMVRHLVNRKPDGFKIAISFEPEILGTGGALTRASWFLSGGNPFWIVNADVAADVDGRKIAQSFIKGKTIASAWLMASRGPRTVECFNGSITNFETRNRGADGTYTFCGVHVVDPAILRYLPPEGFASIIEAYKKAMADGWRVAGVPIENAYWADIGTPDQYVSAESDMRMRATKTDRALDDRVAIVNGMIYGPGVDRKPYTGIMALRAKDALDTAEYALAKKWPQFDDNAVACPLSPRGSARSFTRLYSGRHSAVMIRHQPEREENQLYVSHTKFLRAIGVPVPGVIAEDSARHLALFADAGEKSIQDVVPSWSSNKLEDTYKKLLVDVVRFHERGAGAARKKHIRLMPPFDQKLYRWEHDLFANLFLRDYLGVTEKECAVVRKEMEAASNVLLSLPMVLLHRDLQSSNILINGRSLSFIDYQGMRMGPAVYDLASLLCDPYITIPTDTRTRLLCHYAGLAKPESRVHETFWHAAIQRLGQALGAYARLSRIPGTEYFARHIPIALKRMSEALALAPEMPVLAGIVRRAECAG